MMFPDQPWWGQVLPGNDDDTLTALRAVKLLCRKGADATWLHYSLRALISGIRRDLRQLPRLKELDSGRLTAYQTLERNVRSFWLEKEGRRKVKALRDRAEKLAGEIENFNAAATFIPRRHAYDWSYIFLEQSKSGNPPARRLPSDLRNYVRALDFVLKMTLTKWESAEMQAIGFLMWYVKDSTGRYHDEEVANLINPVLRQHGIDMKNVGTLRAIRMRRALRPS